MSSLKSHGSLRSKKSQLSNSSSLPDFNAIHDSYSKAVIRGRHPTSFPKKSELWYHYHNSSERLERISKGHGFWGVINDQDEERQDGQSVTEAEGKLKFTFTQPPRAVQLRNINGMQVDMKV